MATAERVELAEMEATEETERPVNMERPGPI